MVDSVRSKNSSYLNVLVLGEYFPPDLGGAATRASNIVRGLRLNGCNVTVVTAFPHYPNGNIPKKYKYLPLKVEMNENIKVIRTFVLPFESKGLFKRLLVFLSFITSSLTVLPFVGSVDVIWAANPDVFVLLPATFYGFFKKKPIISNTDDLIIDDLYDLKLVKKGTFVSRIAEFFTRLLFKRVTGVTPISPGYIKTINQSYLVAKDRIKVIRGGVDLSLFSISGTKQRNESYFTVLYVGVLGVGYDFDQILKAARILAVKDSSVRFVLHGGGESVERLKQVIRELALPNIFLDDTIFNSREEVVNLMDTADVLILPMKDFGRPYRGIATKLYEYQAMGKPIICCGDGQPAMHIAETNSGIVVKPGDYNSIVTAVIHLKKNPEYAQELGLNGRIYVEKEASIDSIGSQMKMFYFDILKKNKKQR